MKRIYLHRLPQRLPLAHRSGKRRGDVCDQGTRCPKGRDFAEKECTAPTRSLCTTVKTLGGGAPVLPVRTAGELPKERLFEAMAVLNAYTQTVPVYCGDVLIPDLLGTGCAVCHGRLGAWGGGLK